MSIRLGVVISICLLFMLSGCKTPKQKQTLAPGHLTVPVSDPKVVDEIPSMVTATPVLPPEEEEPKLEKYTIVVHDVPLRDFLFALARGAKINVDIHPQVKGTVSMNAVKQTMPAILERLKDQVDLRYKFQDGLITIRPDSAFWRTYKVDYLNLERTVTSTISAELQIGEVGDSTAGTSSTTSVSNKNDHTFWEPLITGVENIIKLDNANKKSVEAAQAQAATATQQPNALNLQDPTQPAAGQQQQQQQQQQGAGESGESPVVAHQTAGILSVLATERQHEQVQIFLDNVLENARRQVLIEASVVEITLSDSYQAGIDWQRLTDSGMSKTASATSASNYTGTSMGSVNMGATAMATSPYSLLTIAKNTANGDAFYATLRMLSSFGDLSVISSPKLVALNNQEALLKIVDQRVYFEISYETETDQDTNVATTTYDTTIKTVPEGLVLGVVAQISESGNIKLKVRPSLTRVLEWKAQPDNQNNLVPEIQVREMESVLEIADGQMVVLGGMMDNKVTDTRNTTPFLSDIPLLGSAFQYRSKELTKTELAILIRPTVVTSKRMDRVVRELDGLLPKPGQNWPPHRKSGTSDPTILQNLREP
uniref:Putative Type II secretory system protein n=1 Tax=Magnetococcus massalia (strain MO-1) TaxID=451514 RepID=A0A1S7LLS9_MAGMO|nr:putative Type II secretory system protein [Candidatus Magnetococcus massalia]